MPLYSVQTRHSVEEILDSAVAYFGEEGLGLDLKSRDRCCVLLEGGGGHVSVTAEAVGEGSTVELETREWDFHVKRFMRQVGKS